MEKKVGKKREEDCSMLNPFTGQNWTQIAGLKPKMKSVLFYSFSAPIASLRNFTKDLFFTLMKTGELRSEKMSCLTFDEREG